MPELDIRSLFDRYCNKSADESEIQQLMEWMADAANVPMLLDMMKHQWDTVLSQEFPAASILPENRSEEILDSILVNKIWQQSATVPSTQQPANQPLQTQQPTLRPRKSRRTYFSIAAALIALLGITIWLLQSHPTAESTSAIKDIQPGGTKAILTLADGSTITLDSAGNGTLTRQDQTTIIKMQDGALAYNTNSTSNTPDTYNTISTPKGGQYEVILPDGSTVWLNAASSLRFPVAFNGKERIVQLTGEAFFDIHKDPAKPFHVQLGNTTRVDVLGTEFDINDYDNEDVLRASLLDGSIRLNHSQQTALLKPNEQGIIEKNTTRITIAQDINMEKVSAWKNGRFDFVDDDIQTIMRQLERWYNITVVYDGPPPPQTYTGEIRRQVPISQVLKMLRLAGGVDFEINGNIITVHKPSK